MKVIIAITVVCSLIGSAFPIVEDDVFIKATGGLMTKPYSGKGCILILNGQDKVPTSEIAECFSKITDLMHLPVSFKDGKLAGVPSSITAKENGADFIIVLTNDPSITSQLRLSPDERWALVNIAPLCKDNPTPLRLRDRVQKSTMRAFGWLCGCVNASYENSVMGPMRTLVDMDRVQACELPIDSYNRVIDYLYGFRVRPYVVRTYESACKEGWASAPTNDIQKAIWDKVHQMPTEPIKIKPETKKVEK